VCSCNVHQDLITVVVASQVLVFAEPLLGTSSILRLTAPAHKSGNMEGAEGLLKNLQLPEAERKSVRIGGGLGGAHGDAPP